MPISSNSPDPMTTVFESDGVRVVDSGSRLDVVLCSPANRNAQTPRTWSALAGAREFITADTRVIVLSGEGASFSAGLDRTMLGAPTDENPITLASLAMSGEQALREFISQAQSAFTWWRACEVPTIAVVQGHAIGAGFQLALACDLVIALPDASFAMREPRLGLVPDLGGTHPLVRAVGYPRALEICATGRAIEAPEAFTLGIAHYLVSAKKPEQQISAIVEELTVASRGTISDLKSLLQSAEDADHARQLDNEREAQIRRIAALMREST
ncbi:MAG: putative enoyl-CoA hydratase [Actinomycetota bacterium]